jgi:aryl-alcohol dehydrogenase-like predicted oxidoreductase
MSTASTTDPPEQAGDDFEHRYIKALGKRVYRLGLACNYGIDDAAIRSAFARGVNYVFWPIRDTSSLPALRQALRRNREGMVVAAIPSTGYVGFTLRRAAEKALRELQTDYLDIFQMGWLGRSSAWTDGTVGELLKLREEGKVRAIGVSIHDRPRAGKLAADSPLDMLMIRYNAAHPGAERDIFPHIAERPISDAARHPAAIVAYTATSWGGLLKRPAGYDGRVPTAGDCYRFCLSNPHVDVVLSGPASQAELDENLAALKQGPLSAADLQWMREFGRLVHEKNILPFSPR